MTKHDVSKSYPYQGFRSLTKQEQIAEMEKMNKLAEPLQRNISECSKQVKASQNEVERFLKREPQETMEGKCLVACVLRRNQLLKDNRIQGEVLLESNVAVYGRNSEVVDAIQKSMDECLNVVSGVFEICEMASTFNDCMHKMMDGVLSKVTMEQRMAALKEMELEEFEDDDIQDEDEDEEIDIQEEYYLRDEL